MKTEEVADGKQWIYFASWSYLYVLRLYCEDMCVAVMLFEYLLKFHLKYGYHHVDIYPAD